MVHSTRATTLVILSMLLCGVSASADTLRCKSVNGNLNCAGSGGMSCQSVNGKQVCVSGHGDVVQSFGGGAASDMTDDNDLDEAPVPKHGRLHVAKPPSALDRLWVEGD